MTLFQLEVHRRIIQVSPSQGQICHQQSLATLWNCRFGNLRYSKWGTKLSLWLIFAFNDCVDHVVESVNTEGTPWLPFVFSDCVDHVVDLVNTEGTPWLPFAFSDCVDHVVESVNTAGTPWLIYLSVSVIVLTSWWNQWTLRERRGYLSVSVIAMITWGNQRAGNPARWFHHVVYAIRKPKTVHHDSLN